MDGSCQARECWPGATDSPVGTGRAVPELAGGVGRARRGLFRCPTAVSALFPCGPPWGSDPPSLVERPPGLPGIGSGNEPSEAL